jgi:hypothetical protein
MNKVKEVSLLIVIRKEGKRWLKALKIAKIIFEDQGYHPGYLDEVERVIKRKIMQSAKIKEEYFPIVFKISASKRIPMTQLVNQIIRNCLNEEERVYERESEAGFAEHSRKV